MQKEIARSSVKFITQSVPNGMELIPQNIAIASKSTDSKNPKEDIQSEVPIDVWVNKSNSIYHKDDRLIVYLRPEDDCYVRAYYIQSDGAVLQIFPTDPGESGFLKKGQEFGVGGEEDNVELICTDDTLGQEFVKVFTSRNPFDDSFTPRQFIEGANVYQVRAEYKDLKRSLTRGLKIKDKSKTVVPAAEVKLLIQ